MNSKIFGQKIREKRKERGLSCSQLAELCNVNQGYIRQIEAGVKFPSAQLLLILCKILNTSPNYLYEFSEDQEDKEILSKIYKLTPAQKQLVIYLLDAFIKYKSDTTDINIKK